MVTVRCGRCRGQGQVAGMGGIMGDCSECNGVGKVSKAIETQDFVVASERIESVQVSAVDIIEKPVDEMSEVVHEKVKSPKKKKTKLGKSLGAYKEPEILDDITRACLEEPSMDPLAWKHKYQNVEGLFAKSFITGQQEELITKVQRASIRASYAMQRPIAPRTVDMGKSQDIASKNDSEYKAYKVKEKELIDKAAKKAGKK